jgi:ADP-heptose:LPS heptosyltransferase
VRSADVDNELLSMLKKYFNPEEFKVTGEVPLLIKLRLKHLFSKKRSHGERILIVDTCIIGDFVATLPAVRMFIESTKKDVDIIVSPPLKGIAQSIKGIHTVFTANSIYKRSIEKEMEQTILPNNYECVLTLRISPDAYELLSTIQFSKLVSYDIKLIKYFFHLFWKIFLKKEVRQWRSINFDMIGIKEPEKSPGFDDIFEMKPGECDQVEKFLDMIGNRKRVLIHTGSGWHVKLWDKEKWLDTIWKINRLGDFDFIFIGQGEVEKMTFEYIRQRLDFKIHSLINKVDLKTTLLIMRSSDYFIGIDSGPRNMAHLADLRSITLLGPAPKNFMPTNKTDIVVDKFTCRCKSLFYFHTASAINTISSDEIVDSFKKLMQFQVSERTKNHTELKRGILLSKNLLS